MAVFCRGCEQWYPRDPAEDVDCPRCPAKAGQKCRRPSGHPCDLHIERDALALKLGVIQPCPGKAGSRLKAEAVEAPSQGVLPL